jgi:hypothetical protein
LLVPGYYCPWVERLDLVEGSMLVIERGVNVFFIINSSSSSTEISIIMFLCYVDLSFALWDVYGHRHETYYLFARL